MSEPVDLCRNIDAIIRDLRDIIDYAEHRYRDLEARHAFTVARLIDATTELNALKSEHGERGAK